VALPAAITARLHTLRGRAHAFAVGRPVLAVVDTVKEVDASHGVPTRPGRLSNLDLRTRQAAGIRLSVALGVLLGGRTDGCHSLRDAISDATSPRAMIGGGRDNERG
jgi:hypothetical protein